MLLKVNMTDEIVNQVIYYFSLFICRINTKEGWKDNLSYLQRQAQWLEIAYSLRESQRVRETA